MNLNLTVVYSNLMVSISNDIMCFEGGVVEVNRSGTVKGKMTTESLSAVAWLQDFCNSYAEKLPNESKLNLPPCLTKQYVYGLYLEKATNPVSKSHFYKLWKRELPNVTIPKVSKMYIIMLYTSIYVETGLNFNFVLDCCREVVSQSATMHTNKRALGHMQRETSEGNSHQNEGETPKTTKVNKYLKNIFKMI